MKGQAGFSLVELAIVLVIIGLIVGGILTGQDLIKASELNSVISEKNKYFTAVNTFKLKYNGMPGDLRNATSYWSGTANGNNNGNIDNSNEAYRAWQHLTLSGLIPGTYTGTHTGGASVIGTNTPPAVVKPGGWGFYPSTSPWSLNIPYNYLSLGVEHPYIPIHDILTPQDAYSIDGKIDDGLPAIGKVIGGGFSGTDCGSANTSAGVYNLAVTSVTCGMIFQQ